jgi:hypothetical protein
MAGLKSSLSDIVLISEKFEILTGTVITDPICGFITLVAVVTGAFWEKRWLETMNRIAVKIMAGFFIFFRD